jgi:hypothetical protein
MMLVLGGEYLEVGRGVHARRHPVRADGEPKTDAERKEALEKQAKA